jgi:hypothetical protein
MAAERTSSNANYIYWLWQQSALAAMLTTSLDYVPTLPSTFSALFECYRNRCRKLLTCINIVYIPGMWTSNKGNSINWITVHTCTNRKNVILEIDQAYCYSPTCHIYGQFLSQYLHNYRSYSRRFRPERLPYCPLWRHSKQNTTRPKHSIKGSYVAEARKSHLFDYSTHSDFCTWYWHIVVSG